MRFLFQKRFWRAAIHLCILRPLLRMFFGLVVIGRENIEDRDQFIMVANHNSHLDIVLLFALLPVRLLSRTHAVADELYFARSRLLTGMMNLLLQPIWIRRGDVGSNKESLEIMRERLARGESLIIFPEGTRGEPGKLQHFKSGIGRLLADCPNIPIVPVLLTGPERALPRTSSLLLPFWNNALIGPPQISRGTHREITRQLEAAIRELAASESARRHRRLSAESSDMTTIAVLGIDGSGKSSVSKRLAEFLSDKYPTCLIGDELQYYEDRQPRDIQPLISEKIRKYISDKAKRATSLKSYKIPKLAELLLRDHLLHEVGRWYRPRLVISDGSPLLNLMAWSVLYKGDNIDNESFARILDILTGENDQSDADTSLYRKFPELTHIKRLGLAHLVLPDQVILINVDAAIACKRITDRGEARQVHETEDQLGRLAAAYRRVAAIVNAEKKSEVTLIDGALSFDEVVAKAQQFVTDRITKGESQ